MKQRITISGSGSIREYKRGRVYYIRWRLPIDEPNGKPKWSPMRTVHGTKAEAREALLAYKAELEDELNKSGLKVTDLVREFEANRKLNASRANERDTLSPLTLERDTIELRRIKALFGDIPVEDLTAKTITSTYQRIRRGEPLIVENGRPVHLSEDAIHKLNAKLRQVMDVAVDDEIIDVNPCARVRNAKRPSSDERKALTLEQARDLIRKLKTEPRDGRIVCVWLALALGLRRGEALGLIWDRVDLENRRISIDKQLDAHGVWRRPKTRKSVRELPIDEGTAEFLGDWKSTQSDLFFNGGRVPGDTPVCTQPVAPKFIDPTNFDGWRRRKFVEWGLGEFTETRDLKEDNDDRVARNRRKQYGHVGKGYKGFNLHELRHTLTTLVAASTETTDKGLMDWLGHTTQATTSRYTHHVEKSEQDIADFIGRTITNA